MIEHRQISSFYAEMVLDVANSDLDERELLRHRKSPGVSG